MPAPPIYLTRANAPSPRRRPVVADSGVARPPRLTLGRHMLNDFGAPLPPLRPWGLE
ncbi:hypothetical protein ACFOMD_02050 [Sphingoaurantiacus capsulatus]|uniref:Uncharacterized protein n=1 Tax=Sphingoaurantiacus capsulatus TaxID=1771310 RepID=A0ABV7X5F4_9SPHN